MNSIQLKVPATIANLSCGFDILGLCLETPYDIIKINKIQDRTVKIIIEDNEFSNIPDNPKLNTGGFPALKIIDDLNLDFGFEIILKKGIPLSGGLGSSAATAVGVVYGINYLLDNIFDENKIISYALEGEKISSNTPHADNIGPCLKGGLILVKDTYPPNLIKLSISDFYISIIHPKIEINTKHAREILPEKINLSDAVKQWGNISGLTAGFITNDIELIKSSMHDYIIEPLRSKLIVGYDQIKKSAINNGAIGCSISGSGPSIFSLCENNEIANQVLTSMTKILDDLKIDYHSYISKINHNGISVIN
jgi:homoserine kinase